MDEPVFLGGQARVARLAVFRWPGRRPLTFARRPGPGIDTVWNMEDPPPPAQAASVVVNFAGVTPGPDAPLARNTDLALAGLAAARAWGARHYFVMSSSAVYGDTGPEPAAESRAPHPVNAYGAAKLAMEQAVLDAAGATDGPKVTILRLANVAGAGQPFDAACAAAGAPISLHRFADGRGPSRSFIGPLTLARCLHALCNRAAARDPIPAVLNVAASPPAAMSDILTALGTPFDWVDAPPGALQHVHLDTRLLATLCADIDMDGGAARTLVSEADTSQAGDPT
ncbi:NAD-dependent epimerase/dehydratase family protein [Oceaniglobus indicus]|uniref:NAD-dependent epimerase/dehydratase family protein n=1 Tax=Oceaniglobus indicus TaxID=2047749 RepID=UPI0013045025|nr:NAD-dependent epimerase/dehydratase family protein [Oceaniglobus indicus]